MRQLVSIFYFTKIPSTNFPSSNQLVLVSIHLEVIKLNPPRFASVTIFASVSGDKMPKADGNKPKTPKGQKGKNVLVKLNP